MWLVLLSLFVSDLGDPEEMCNPADHFHVASPTVNFYRLVNWVATSSNRATLFMGIGNQDQRSGESLTGLRPMRFFVRVPIETISSLYLCR
jgi:hypothetical protein